MKIKRLDWNTKEALELNSLLNEEWSDIGSFKQSGCGIDIPNPIGVFDDGEIVGGLSFTSYKTPFGEEVVVWVNAVLVKPKYRGKGLGRDLVLTAQSCAKGLFALTDIPTLYTKVGWHIVKEDRHGFVVQYNEIT